MDKKTREAIMATDADVVLLDIDGTIKDLVREHQEALKITVNGFNRGKELRKKLVFFVDKIAMSFVKGGALSTNRGKQNFLLNLYAFILSKDRKDFKNLYYLFYKEKRYLFDGTREFLSELKKSKRVYLVTTNEQNYNLEELGVKKEEIYCVQSKSKIYAYKTVIMLNDLEPKQVLVVGDNIFDDIKPAKKLGCGYMLVDCYKSKLKRFMAKLLNVGMK